MKSKVIGRIEVNYVGLKKNKNKLAIETSSPIYSVEEGFIEYQKALTEKCVDCNKTPNIHLWLYNGKKTGNYMKTLARNY